MANATPFSNPNFLSVNLAENGRTSSTTGSVAPSDVAIQSSDGRSLEGEKVEALVSVDHNRVLMSKINLKSQLGVLSTSSIIISSMIGSGIFTYPSTVFANTESVGISFMLWLVGVFLTCVGMSCYLEYGFRYPLSGGELHYVDEVLAIKKSKREPGHVPRRMMTSVFAFCSLAFNQTASNCISFAQNVLIIATGDLNHEPDIRLLRFIAICFITLILGVHAFFRTYGIWLNNALALYKVTLLLFIIMTGFAAIGKAKVSPAEAMSPGNCENPQGPALFPSFSNAFGSHSTNPSDYAHSLVGIIFTFSGFANANFVIEEVKRPPRDENRVFRQAAVFGVGLVSVLYILVNVSYFAISTPGELACYGYSTLLAHHFIKVFGYTKKAETAGLVLVTLSAGGNVVARTFTLGRLKQQIARKGLIPWSRFWVETSRFGTPVRAYILEWAITVIIIIATPSNGGSGYLVLSGLSIFFACILYITLGGALALAPWVKWVRGLRYDINTGKHIEWESKAFPLPSWKFGKGIIFFCGLMHALAGLFLITISLIPSTGGAKLMDYVSPIATFSIYALGVLYWLYFERLLTKLGYRQDIVEYKNNGDVVLNYKYEYEPGKPLTRLCNWLKKYKRWFSKDE